MGYFAYSTDEGTRKAQQERLSQLRKATKAARSKAEDADAERKQALAERLKKVRQRKRLRAGLPLVEKDDEEEEKKDVEPTVKEEEESEDIGPMPAGVEEKPGGKSKKPEQKKPIVRPWDLGKIGVQLGPGTCIHSGIIMISLRTYF